MTQEAIFNKASQGLPNNSSACKKGMGHTARLQLPPENLKLVSGQGLMLLESQAANNFRGAGVAEENDKSMEGLPTGWTFSKSISRPVESV